MAETSLPTMGRYQLLAKLATGGMAEIYLARQTGIKGFERLVAVKKLFAHLAAEEKFLEMFFDEARIAATLNHPNIVQIYDLGQEEDSYYIAMEYLEGESLGFMLRECHRTKTTIPPTLASAVVSQVCDGLDYAHKLTDEAGKPLGIVHRDVSPQNIIVLFSGGVKLVDFGIAKAASKSHKTSIGMFKGKLAYMSPEQCLGKPVDHRSDIFSLGAVYWELLAQRRLFKGDSKLSVMESIVSGEVPPLRKYKPDFSIELEAITLQALQKDPNKRFKSAREMGAAIQAYLRRIGAAAGVQEVAAFASQVFEERAQKKRRLMEALRSGDTTRVTQVTLDVLKPVTGDSSPSPDRLPEEEDTQRFQIMGGGVQVVEEPRAMDLQQAPPAQEPGKPEQEALEAETREIDLEELAKKGLDIKSLLTTPEKPPVQKPRTRRLLPFIILPGLAAAVGFIWWLAVSTGSDEPGPTQPLGVAPVPPVEPSGGPIAQTDGGAGDGGGEPSADAVLVAKINPALDVQPVRLKVTSQPPGCRVQIDSRDLAGQTPQDDLTVDSGTDHQVTVLCKHHLEESKNFKGLPGEEIVLHFAPARAQAAPKVAELSPPSEAPKAAKPKISKTKTQYGRLRMDTEPWSVVYVGKKKLGMTPILNFKLPAGTHKVTVVNKEQGLKKTFRITIRPKKTTTIFQNLSQ